jgi:N-acetylneuraminic acid mutarotase
MWPWLAAGCLATLSSVAACDGSAMPGAAPPGSMPIAGTPDAGAPPPLSQGRWEVRPDMPAPTRTYSSVAALPGQVLVVGGFSTNIMTGKTVVYDTVSAFDTKAGTWGTLEPVPKPIAGANVAAVGGKLYVLGGIGLLESWQYDPASHQWTAKKPVPVVRGFGVSAVGVSGTRILLGGGAEPGQSNNNLNTGVRVNHVLAYDTVADSWERLPELEEARGYAMGAVLGNTFWVIGGSNSIERTDLSVGLDLATRVWARGTPPPLLLSSAGSAVLDGRLYAIGGIATTTGTIGPLTLVFDPTLPPARAWDMVASLNTPRFATGAAALDGRIYFPGGVALINPPATYATVGTMEVFIP